jgi:predicted ATPase
VRSALDWAFSPNGDTSIGVVLTTAVVPLWLQQSLLLECRSRAERALTSLAPGPGRDAREMQLDAALGVSLMHTKGAAPETVAAWTKVLELAERLGDSEYQLRALQGLWNFHASRGEGRRGLALAERFRDRATDTADHAVGERMVGVSLHYLGDQVRARQHVATMLEHYVDSVRRSHAGRFQYDQRIAAQNILARILWVQGFPEQAWRTTQDNVDDARTFDHALSLSNALEIPCLVALWCGDLAATEESVTALLNHTTRHALAVRHQAARCFSGALLIARGKARDGLDVLRPALGELRETSFVPYYPVLLGTLAQGLSGVGQLNDALETIEEALAKCERDEERWWIAELLRIKAELLLLARGMSDAAKADAEEQLQHALQWTRHQSALSLELRCATDLARLWHAEHRTEQARELVAKIYGRFSEGFTTADLRVAKTLLENLA